MSVCHFLKQVRLMYERVPLSKAAIPQHLNDPVIEYVPIYRREQEHRLYNLPVGKYIVCGEAMSDGNVFQANCVEALIRKQGNRSNKKNVGLLHLPFVYFSASRRSNLCHCYRNAHRLLCHCLCHLSQAGHL